jgi:hypothetical protein
MLNTIREERPNDGTPTKEDYDAALFALPTGSWLRTLDRFALDKKGSLDWIRDTVKQLENKAHYPKQHAFWTTKQKHLGCNRNQWLEYSTRLLVLGGFITPEGKILKPWQWDHIYPCHLSLLWAPDYVTKVEVTEDMFYHRLVYTNLYPTDPNDNIRKGRWSPGPLEPINMTTCFFTIFIYLFLCT